MTQKRGCGLIKPFRRVGRPTQRNQNCPDEKGNDQEATDGELYDGNKDGEPNGLSEPRVWRSRCRHLGLRWRWSCSHGDCPLVFGAILAQCASQPAHPARGEGARYRGWRRHRAQYRQTQKGSDLARSVERSSRRRRDSEQHEEQDDGEPLGRLLVDQDGRTDPGPLPEEP